MAATPPTADVSSEHSTDRDGEGGEETLCGKETVTNSNNK